MNRKIKVLIELLIHEKTDLYEIFMEDRPLLTDLISLNTFLEDEVRQSLSEIELGLLFQYNVRFDCIEIMKEYGETIYYCYCSIDR